MALKHRKFRSWKRTAVAGVALLFAGAAVCFASSKEQKEPACPTAAASIDGRERATDDTSDCLMPGVKEGSINDVNAVGHR